MGGSVHARAAQAIAEAAERRPCDMTDEELEALPVGPFIRRQRPVTRDDHARGIHGRVFEWAECPPLRVTAWTTKDIFAWRDGNGELWDFGQWSDGRWFKQASVLS